MQQFMSHLEGEAVSDFYKTLWIPPQCNKFQKALEYRALI